MNKVNIMDFFQKRINITAGLLCMAGIALNMVLNAVADIFDLPLFLDTAGTIAVAAMGGYLPGVLVGFATNILRSMSEPSAIYYGVLNVLIAMAASFLCDRGWHKKVFGIIGMVIIFTLIGGGLGSLIRWLMEGLSLDNAALSGAVNAQRMNGLPGLGESNPLSRLFIDLQDKVITVILSVSIVRLIPEQYYYFFRFDILRQNAAVDLDVSENKKTDVRVVSLRIKTLLVLVFSLTAVAITCTALGANVFRKMFINERTQLAGVTAKLAGKVIDGDRVDEYLESKGSTEDYIDTKYLLGKLVDGSTETSYLYVYKIDSDGCHVVFDLDPSVDTADKIGTVVPLDRGFTGARADLLAGREVKPVITNDRFGALLTFYQPVYDSDGRCVCYVGVDVNMEKLNMNGLSFIAEMVLVFLSFFILLCIFTIWLTNYQLILPINSIVSSMNHLASTYDTQESMDEDVKRFRALGIHTGDELENLYRSACRMTKNQAEQMRSIRRLSDSTAKMQDGLIITMADMVESRDSDTGAHIQKTSAYVKIIAEGLREKGYYMGKLTPKFMSDVVRSAPLHDIGKINIPDDLLSKHGKLTDEEYEIMKTHTTAGKQIIENVISTVEGDNYLKEARNMAAYHHERWDGTGYPEGIHGEVIPLSARIMAVADVFDALSSPRVYRTEHSVEKALAILEEGKGTQFDPKCVEVFLDALPEIKVILNKYNQTE